MESTTAKTFTSGGKGRPVVFTRTLSAHVATAMKMKNYSALVKHKTKNPMTCEYHQLANQIECEHRARDAANVIHSVMGRGHSNLCEAHFTVLLDYRSKDQNLCR